MKRTNRQQGTRVFGALAIILTVWALWIGTGARAQHLDVVSQIGGGYRAVQVEGNFAYAGEGPSLVILDVSNPDVPLTISRLLLNPANDVRDIRVAGGLAYVADQGASSSLEIVDVSNPFSPTRVSSYLTSGSATGVFEASGLAYIAASDLVILDVSDPSSPTLRCRYRVGSAQDVVASGSLAYVAASGSGFAASGNLLVLDVSDSSSPTLRGSAPRGGRAVAVLGQLAYVGGSGGFSIFDVSDPSSPTLQGSLSGINTYNLYVTSSTAYLGMSRGLDIVDVSDPTSPVLRSFYNTRTTTRGVWVSGSTAYLGFASGSRNALNILDVSDPTSPMLRRAVASPATTSDVFVESQTAALAGNSISLETVSVANPQVPAGLASYSSWNSFLPRIFVSEQRAFVAGGSTLKIVDIGDPSSPTLLSQNFSPASDVMVVGNLAYVVSTTSNPLQIFDVSNPSSPTLLGSSPAPGGTGIYVSSATAYVVAGPSLQIFDVSNPSSPTLLGSCATSTTARSVYVSGGFAYVACSTGGLQIVDVTNLSSPMVRGSYPTLSDAWDVKISGGLAYIASVSAQRFGQGVFFGPGALEVVDVANPSSPTLCASYSFAIGPAGLHLHDRLIYVATPGDGMWILRYTPLLQPPAAPSNLTATAISSSQINLAWQDNSDTEEGFTVERKTGLSGMWSVISSQGPDVITYPDTGVQPATTYFYRVQAFSAVGNSAYSNETSATTPGAVPVAPSNLTATADSSSEIGLRWQDNSDNEGGFKIERKTAPSDTWSEITTVTANAYVHHDLGLTPSTTYTYRVRAYNMAGDSAYSNEASTTTFGPPPAAPSNLTATVVSLAEIDLAWQDNSDNENGFNVERKVGAAGSWTPITSLPPANATTYQDTNGGVAFLPGTTYFYRVQAWNLGGVSAYSNEASATTPGGDVNLTLSNCDISPVAPIQLMPNGPIALGALVQNTGENAVGPFWTEVWGSRTGGLTLDRFLTMSLRLSDGLPGGGSYSWVTTTSLLGIPDGPYTVVYAVDRPGDASETNERDNRAVVKGKRILVIRPQTVADLAVENFRMSPNPAQSGGQVAFSGRVVNRGQTITGAFWIEFWGSWDWPYPNLNFFLCDSIFVENLNPGMAVDLANYPRQLYNVPDGVFMVGCFADRDDSISESNETNNYQFVDGQVFNRAALESRPIKTSVGADIVVRSADVSPVSPAQLGPGNTVTLTVEVANIGTANTGPFWLEYWGSRDGGVTIRDFLADSTHFANLAPGQTVRLSTTKQLYSIPDGPYSVVVFADRPGNVEEANEANNRLTIAGKRLLVIRPPSGANLVVEDFRCSAEITQCGFQGLVRNIGTGNSGPFWIEVWLCPGDPDYPWLDRFACDSIHVDNLAPGGEFNLDRFYARPLYVTPTGSYTVICFVDRPDQVAETDETDNYAIARGVTVLPH
jgi:hypothetical protein